MPRKPKTPCKYPGCDKLVEGTYCEEHKKITDKQYNQYQRDRKVQRFYQSPEWRAVRRRKLDQNPLCEECLKHNKVTKATMVDHIVPIKQGGEAFNMNNLQSLCNECHSRKSVQEGSRYGGAK